MWRALCRLNHQHLILLQEQRRVGGWGGCVDSGGESIEARRYTVHTLACACLQVVGATTTLIVTEGSFLLVERAAQRKVASRAMGRPAAYLRFEIRVRLVRPQPQHVPLQRGRPVQSDVSEAAR
jgi:hypothetical protein